MTVKTSTGITFGVVKGGPATHDEAGFGALVFVNVGEVTDLPEYGPTTSTVTHEPLATGVTQKEKGFIDYGSTSVALGHDITDAGQVILSAGVDGDGQFDEHSFSVTDSDGDIDYYTGKIFSYTRNPGSANSIISSTVAIEINTKIVTVEAV
jgi:hypothetical protein